MADDNKSGLSEAVEKGSSVASAVAGAVKTGKAIAGAAKGAALGPYGAAVGVLWENRKTVAKIVAAAAALLILPVLFILMLPSLIFGGLNSEAASPILNDNAAIIENLNDISFSLNDVLAAGIDDVLARIAADFAASGADNYGVVNPYGGNLLNSANLFIAQYCASKDADFQSVSLADMERVLRGAKSELYSFTRKSETVNVIVYNEETEEDETVTETWLTYTIVYNGEDYFADSVFRLSDTQKRLARSYAENLSLFLGDGSVQYLADSSGGVSYAGVVFADGVTEVVYYNQTDARFADKPYGTDDVGGYGCGPTSMSIVVSSLSGETVDPVQMAKWSYENGYWCSKSGSYHGLIPAAAKEWGLPVEGCSASEPQRIVDALASGKLVVALMAKGHFTNSGHFIVLRGITSDGKVLVADPGSYKRSGQEWDLPLILDEASHRAGAGGPFWIIG
jgi:hypothetical protein